MGRLDGRCAIVTGAGSGIGRATARLFDQEGARVVAVDVSDAGLAETAAGAREIETRKLDAANEAGLAELVAECVSRRGGLHAVYANAGISGESKQVLDLEVAEWEEVLRVNLLGVFLAIKYAGAAMRDAGGGSIIATASVAGLRSGAGPSPYSASKAGVISLVQTAANQLSNTGVRVNAICPGLIETGMTRPIFDLARSHGNEHKLGQLNPLKRAGAPEEIARLALFLASDDSSYVNGQAIACDGGLSSSHPFVPGHLS